MRAKEAERPQKSNNEDRATMKFCHKLRQTPKGELRGKFVCGVDKSLRGVEVRNGFHLQCWALA